MAKAKLTNPDITSLCIDGKQIDADGSGYFELPDDAASALAEHGLSIKPGRGQSNTANANGGQNG